MNRLAAFVLGACALGVPVSPALGEERFDVFEYRVLGAATLPARAVERAVYPHLGTGRSIEDVQAARESLERAYRDAGFGTVFVDVPEQDVEDGIVRLQVTEGRLDRVRLGGARYYSQRRIRASLPSVEPGAVVHLPSLQRDLDAVNSRSPDLGVTPILKAGRYPGTVDLDLQVRDSLPLQGSLELNDRYTPDTSRLRSNLTLAYSNLWQRDHALSLMFETSPEERDEVQVLAGSYTLPLGRAGRALSLSAIRSDSDVAALGTLGVLGRGTIVGAKVLWGLPAGNWFHSVAAGLDYKDVDEIVRTAPPSAQPDDDPAELRRPIEYVAWSLTHGASRQGEGWAFSSSLAATFGTLSVVNDAPDFNLKRFRAPPNFFYLRGSASVEWPLPLGFGLLTRASAQYSPTPLISNEQFSIGGIATVRGFLEAEEFGDYGFAATLELAAPSLRLGEDGLLRLLAFTDAGVVRLNDALPGQPRRTDLSSAGLGLRLDAWQRLTATLDWAYPLVPSSRVDEGESRVHFGVRYGF